MKVKNKGITLIALVITIIVLLILAGVTINAILGENGVIEKAKEAKEKMQIASEKEKIELVILDLHTEKIEKGKLTVNEVIDELIEKGITTEGNSTKADETKGEITGNVTLDSGNNYTLTEDENTVKVDYNGPSDNILPRLEITKDTEGSTGKVTLTIIATENINGIKQILRDGEEVNHYTEGTKKVIEKIEITENGTYEITVISGINKEVKQTITINNIDKDSPTARYELTPEEGSYGTEVVITIIAEDSNGIASITTPEGVVTKENLTKINDITYQTTYSVTENGEYAFSITDEAGHTLEDYKVTISNVDRTGPEITEVEKVVEENTITVTITGVRDVGVGTEGVEYRYFISKDNSWTQYSTSATQEFTGLEGGTEYTIKVQAKDSLSNVGEVFSITDTTKISNIKEYHNGVPIPKGFYYVGGESATGLVISDNPEDEKLGAGQTDITVELKGNQFVWVPVEVTTSDTETNIASFQRTKTYDGTITTPDALYTEPFSLGKLSATNDLTGEYAEYKEMVKSVYHHKGFYVARFEAGCEKERTSDNKAQAEYQGTANPVLSQKNKFVYNYVPWGASMESTTKASGVKGAVELSRGMYPVSNTSYGAVSHLMYGLQWDAVMRFVQDSTHSVTDSRSWGNYNNSTGNALEGRGQLRKTGYNEAWKAKNMYDIAGNAWEWTMEANSADSRVLRGGGYVNDGGVYPTSYRHYLYPVNVGSDLYNFRTVLYVKN